MDAKNFRVLPSDETNAKIASIIDPSVKFILFVGGIDRRKNIASIVQA